MEHKLLKFTPQLKNTHMSDEFFEFKAKIHDRLLDIIDLSIIDSMDKKSLTVEIRQITEKILKEESDELPLNLL